ncbi:unnamed protein product [Prunus armeniaca]
MQGKLCRNFGRKSRAPTSFGKGGYSFSEWARHRGDVGNSTGFVPGFELLKKSFEDIRGKLTRLASSRAHVEEPNGDVGTSYPQLRIKDPHRVKVKGRAKRVKEEKENAVQRHKRCSSSSDTEFGGPVGENLQPTQSTQDNEPTMTESFMQEFDFMYGLGV